MKSDSNSDSEDADDGQLIIVTSNVTSNVQCEIQTDDINNLYSDGIIENLWKAKAMGNYGPEEILVSIWFFISHYFGISSRTDHAKLCLGNIIVENEGSTKIMLFNRNFNCLNDSKNIFNTRFTPKTICETPQNKDKCPLTIFETYLTHRPSNFCYPAAPLYLQPDKSVSQDYEGPWYAAAGLGKNRIGALFNAALSKSGRPTIRHYNSRRQIIGDTTKACPSLATKPPTVVDSSPKIKLRICHLSSGNPVVTQALLSEDCVQPKKTKGKPGMRKRAVELHSTEERISTVERVGLKEELMEKTELQIEQLDFTSKKFAVKPTKRMWSMQKSIINITSRESNPIARQIMMHLGMSRDPLVLNDCRQPGSGGTGKASRHAIALGGGGDHHSGSGPTAVGTKSRLLRSSVRQLYQLHLPLWPSIDKFCDAELQHSMEYRFDDDRNSRDGGV